MIPVLEGAFGVCLVGASIVAANRHTLKTPWHRRYWNVAVGVGALWLVLSVALSFAPVMREASAVVVLEQPGVLRVTMTAVKVRDCRWVRTDAYVTDQAGNRHEASLVWVGDRNRGNSKPPGRYKFEPARVEFDADIQPASVELVATHSCGWMWRDAVTTAGPWAVPLR